ncbi:MAG: manganese-dependent inorganic pyrophosphatase [Alphaproteobacteria bacterium]
MTIYVMGHKNPDTDTIVASIAATALLKARGLDAVACRQGELNPESKFVLDTFKLEIPEMIESVEGKDIAIVDTTNPTQLPDDLSNANITFIADHHNLAGIKTATVPEMYVQPVGSSCTVLSNIFGFEGKKIPSNIAGAMMLAILSDTVLFKSPTVTEWDKVAVENLAKIAGVEKPLELGLQMLKIKSSIENDTAIDLINRDFKEFNIKGKKIGIGQIELIDGSMAESKKPAILSEMKKIQNEKGYNSILILITDIMKEGSEMLVVSDDIESIEKVFGVKCDETNCVWIDGMMSRKKQVIPPLETKL